MREVQLPRFNVLNTVSSVDVQKGRAPQAANDTPGPKCGN